MVISGCSGASGAGSSSTAASAEVSESASTDSSETAATEVTADEYAGQTVYGKVTAVDSDTVTVALGEVDESEDNGGSVSLTLTGEQMTVTLSDDTEITGQGGHGGGAPDGMGPGDMAGKGGDDASSESDSAVPEKPADSSDSTDQPQGDSSSDESQDGSSSDTAQGGSGAHQKPDGKPGDKPGGGSQTLEVSDLEEGDIISITIDESGDVTEVSVLSDESGQQGGGQPGGGQSSGVDSYDAATEYTSDVADSGQTIESTGTDENAVHAYEGATVSLSDMKIIRDSDSSTGGDNSSFYGVGASVLETDGTLYLSDSEITSDAKGGAGVFAYGDGTVYLADTLINTSQDTSGGIHVAGGGTLYAWDVTATTQGESSAAIRSDRGGGTMVVDGGTYTSNGTGSPAIYSTADITVNDADLTANNSEAICIEGLNTIRLFDSDLTGNMPDNEQNDCTWNVILYQSMSGDSEVGNSTFEMDGGSLTAGNGGMFYTTNTESTFTLRDVDITYAEANDFFLKCTGNSNQRGWGTAGANGADCLFTAINQEMEGDVIWDSISQLDFYMTDGSTLKGAVVDDESNAGDGGDGYCSLYISEDSTWTVTGDSTLTNLYSAGKIVDEDGSTVTIKGTDGTVYVQGDSEYTITVSSYSTDVDLSGASDMESWSDYEVEEPSELK